MCSHVDREGRGPMNRGLGSQGFERAISFRVRWLVEGK